MTFFMNDLSILKTNNTWLNTKDKWKGDDDHYLTISGDLISMNNDFILDTFDENKYARVSIEKKNDVISQSL